MPFGVDHYILWLQVSIKHALCVHVFHGKDQLRRDESCQVLLEILVQVELLAEVAVITQLHHHVQVVRGLERVHELEHVAVVKLLHDESLCDCVSDLVVTD